MRIVPQPTLAAVKLFENRFLPTRRLEMRGSLRLLLEFAPSRASQTVMIYRPLPYLDNRKLSYGVRLCLEVTSP
jgi:hypothetical protein